MATPLLVVTPDNTFGERIRHSLEDVGGFVVHVTGEQETALVYARELNPPLAFLDASIAEEDLRTIGARLRKVNPALIFVIVSEPGWTSRFEELSPADYISKSFHLPDLLEMLDKFLPASGKSRASALRMKEASDGALPWLQDENRAAQHLTRLTLESSAQAALITRGDQLWAYAGQLPQPAAHELVDTVRRYWDGQARNDLMRFVRLSSTDAEHMLYATGLTDDMVLALIFDAETPFTSIRSRVFHLVHAVSGTPGEASAEKPGKGIEPGARPVIDHTPDMPAPSMDRKPEAGYPNGPRIATPDAWQVRMPPVAIPQVGSQQFARPASLAMHYPGQVDVERDEAADLEQTLPSPAVTHKTRTSQPLPSAEPYQEIHALPAEEGVRQIVLEPVSPSLYNLDYACLLIPRFMHHYLTGDLSERLGECVPQICIAFGWRLEFISIRPDYLQCIVNVPPSASPGHLMRLMRQHTSARIFSDFPRFKKENPSGDFWAPGYLIMGGSQPPPAHLIRDFITQTRQRQGILPQNSR